MILGFTVCYTNFGDEYRMQIEKWLTLTFDINLTNFLSVTFVIVSVIELLLR